MEVLGKLMLFGGLFIALTIQVYIIVLAFKRDTVQALRCFLLPGYTLYLAMRQETRQPQILLVWGASIVIIIGGVALLS